MISKVDADQKPAKGGRPKGYAKTGGRKKGTPNRATAAKVAEVAASGLTPLDYLLSVLRDVTKDEPIRIDAAKAAAPYVHPKLAQVELTGKDGSDLLKPMTELETARHLAFLLTSGLRAKDKTP